MQHFGLALISFALVVAASASPLLNANTETTLDDIPVFASYKPGDKCPAPIFSDGCNTCVCHEGNTYAACTMKACPELDAPNPVFPNYKVGDKCPAKYFNDGCNNCVCSDDGVTAACTYKYCGDKRQTRANAEALPVVYGYQHGDKCPAQQFYNDCNRCACSTDGHSAACTLMACPPRREIHLAVKVPTVYGYEQGEKCPAQQFFDDCNRCACTEDGHYAACTRMACPPRREARSVEDMPVVSGYQTGDKCPAKHFFDKCNKCVCANDGHSAACTRMACPSFDDVVPHIDNFDQIQKCTPHQHFKNRCNDCVCGAEGASAVCTLMMCLDV